MKISVVIPFFNEKTTIEKTLDALYVQTHQPNEVILVDSGSNDNTGEIIDKWITNKRVTTYKVIFDGNMSPSSSINRGIKNSSNELIAYIDCGLKIPKKWLEENLSYFKKNNIGIVSNCICAMGKNIVDKSFISQTYGYATKVPCLPGSLIKKKIIIDCGYFLENTRASYDVDFIKKCMNKNIKRLINKNIVLKYIGINYSNSFINGIKKVFSYSLDSWRTASTAKPISYIVFFLLIILSYLFNFYFVSLLISYIIIRGFLLPLLKSKEILFSKHIVYLFTIPLCGFLIDLSRLTGYLYSLAYNDKF